jgi:UDP-N-acetylglucosamine--N-acetylmuramyl-(pentapeptide) pyrophosphoryl-undecaprenol N-acetylglucosamine transferase
VRPRRAPRPGAGTWAIIAGGGTGGHVVPAIAIGRALVDRGHPIESITFVGSRRGMEARLVPAAGFRVVLLPGRGLARRFTWDNAAAVIGLLVATGRATALMARLRPCVAISVGGYASFPGAVAAIVWRVPLVVAEQNAAPGLANRVVGRFAAACAVSFPATPLPRSVLTGNPVRPQILAVDRSCPSRAAARAELGLPSGRMVVAVAGGSLGARRINDAVLGLASMWSGRSEVAIHHVVGQRDFDSVSAQTPAPPPGGLIYHQVAFEDRMDLVLAAADVAVQRAGASTVAELTVVGLPSILVPLPGAPGDHQSANAHRLAEAGAAVLIPDVDLDPTRLGAELDRLLDDEGLRRRMGDVAKALAHPEAATAVSALAEERARG